MLWPFARSNGGSNSSVTVLIAVETNALISAARAAAVAVSSATRTASMRMTILAVTEPELDARIELTHDSLKARERVYNGPRRTSRSFRSAGGNGPASG